MKNLGIYKVTLGSKTSTVTATVLVAAITARDAMQIMEREFPQLVVVDTTTFFVPLQRGDYRQVS